MRKNTVPVFEKPVIIRPKSTSDLQLLHRKQGAVDTGHVHRELRVEQDLETGAVTSGLQDDKDFEFWVDGMQEDLENASLEKYMSFRITSILMIERTELFYKQDYIPATQSSHKHHPS